MINLKQPIATLRKLWKILGPLPLGAKILSRLFGFFVPYTGSIAPEIVELQPGMVRIKMRDRRAVRNHLQCVHAIAMANLAEAVTGLAVSIALPGDRRAILTSLSTHYLKKGRGNLMGVCRFVMPADFTEGDLMVESTIENEAGETVASASATWRIGISR